MKREKESEKERRRLAAERRAMSNNKNSKKKRALNAQNTVQQKADVIDIEEKQENCLKWQSRNIFLKAKIRRFFQIKCCLSAKRI